MAPDTDRKNSATGQPARPLFLSDHLSNERTYLSYLRTAVSLMSFGIAINRFGVFLEQSRAAPGTHPLSGSARLGIGMVLIGMALLAWAAFRYVLIMHHIERQDFRPKPASILILTTLVLVCGLGGVFWLFIA